MAVLAGGVSCRRPSSRVGPWRSNGRASGAELDAGRLAQVGLVRHHGLSPFELSRDHQVLAFGYALDPGSGSITLRLYDPNHPDRDDVTVTLSDAGHAQNTGEPLLGVIAL